MAERQVHLDPSSGVEVNLLGRGTNSHVYLIEKEDGTKVARKVPCDGAKLGRFEIEIAQSGSSFVPNGISSSSIEGVTCLDMECLTPMKKGENNPVFAKAMALAALNALKSVRELTGKTLVHRDIKPSNMLKRSDGSFVLSDWGECLVLGERAKNASEEEGFIPFGSPQSIAPEATVEKSEAHPGNDMYAIGVLIYTQVTGKFHPAMPAANRDTRTVDILGQITLLLPPSTNSVEDVMGLGEETAQGAMPLMTIMHQLSIAPYEEEISRAAKMARDKGVDEATIEVMVRALDPILATRITQDEALKLLKKAGI
ncbi:MAG: hypothetical protein SP1CHLAM54_03860 [Chlamydiia bacterium]|nr:hypothetical protein [Chlamydiia bacterium]MCH9615301.1 hypothetical protein [Chlamydiia bacterium]MCH9628377.1 hypothetical protein [Chlamydiia bacterium]